jgi:hypothetical protein
MLPLNISHTASRDYTVSNLKFSARNQIFSDKTVLPVEVLLHNVPASSGPKIASIIKAANDASAGNSSYAFKPSVYYSNGQIFENSKSVWANLTILHKGWIWVPNLIRVNNSAPLGNGSYWKNATYFIPGLLYHQKSYVTFGFEGFNASYGRLSGVLLYANTGPQGDLYWAMPAPIVRAFAIGYAISGSPTITVSLVSWFKTDATQQSVATIEVLPSPSLLITCNSNSRVEVELCLGPSGFVESNDSNAPR